ncbi:hypothetical protein [Sphingomonas sp.]|jgi:hypothetical protein|uniref:LexA family protein n=1 Tax=Sphingomonas sp. TaxID=28214 RepID=UPI002EDA7A58
MTPRQLEVLDFVREVIAVAQIVPSMRDIASRFGMGLSQAHATLTALVDAGLLERGPEKTRFLRVPGLPDLRAVPTDGLAAELARRGTTLASLDPRAPAALGRQRTCAADTCGVAVQSGHLMCRSHWHALSLELRERILKSNARRDRPVFERAVTEARDLIDSGAWRRRA